MKKLILKVFVLCLMMVFLATSAYAGAGTVAAAGNNYVPAWDVYDRDDDDDRDDNHNKGKHKKDKKEKKNKGKKKGQEYVAVTGISLNKTKLTLKVGSWERLSASIQPANATDKKYYWFSDNPLVASVNPSGKVTGLKPGTAKIYVATRDGFKTAYSSVTVTGSAKTVHVTGVTLNRTAITLDAGKGQRLSATITPGNATNKAVTWSSDNPKVATVDRNGYVSALKAGTARITVTTEDGGKEAYCTVTVRKGAPITVTSVSIVKTRSYIALKEGATKRLNIQILPANATDNNVTWSTGDSGIVSVNRYGDITGVHEGTTDITVTSADGHRNDTVRVEVIPADEWISATDVSLNLINTTIPAGFAERLRYEIEPSNASDKEVRWSSSRPEIASVDEYGNIKAQRTGTAVITVTTVDGSITDSSLVVVVPAVSLPSRGILLNKSASTLAEGETDYPEVLFYHASADDYSLTWTSNNTAVATVNQNGRVTAVAPGTAVITVRTSNNWRASYTVTVE